MCTFTDVNVSVHIYKHMQIDKYIKINVNICDNIHEQIQWYA